MDPERTHAHTHTLFSDGLSYEILLYEKITLFYELYKIYLEHFGLSTNRAFTVIHHSVCEKNRN